MLQTVQRPGSRGVGGTGTCTGRGLGEGRKGAGRRGGGHLEIHVQPGNAAAQRVVRCVAALALDLPNRAPPAQYSSWGRRWTVQAYVGGKLRFWKQHLLLCCHAEGQYAIRVASVECGV